MAVAIVGLFAIAALTFVLPEILTGTASFQAAHEACVETHCERRLAQDAWRTEIDFQEGAGLR
jgi:hypothetical protein